MPEDRQLTVRSVDVRSVLRVSLVLYACLLLVFVVAWAILWVAAGIFGVTGNVEDFIAKLFALDSFHFSIVAQAIAIVIGGSVLVGLGTGANVLGAIFYNLITELVGGVQIDVEDDAR